MNFESNKEKQEISLDTKSTSGKTEPETSAI